MIKLEEENSFPQRPLAPICGYAQNRYGNNRWEGFSPKLRRNIILTSDIEYDHWVLIESDPLIKSFCEYPCRVRVNLPIGPVTTIFDMWILWHNNDQEYREVKYLSELLQAAPNSRIDRQIKAQKMWCALQNNKHSVMTDDVIRANPLFLSNWKSILSTLASTQDIDLSPHIENISYAVAKRGGGTLREIEQSVPGMDRTLVMASVFTLIQRGLLKAPLDTQSLTTSTRVDNVH
jgi:hypothetical protein